jgi:hypothetical protein
LTNTLHWTLARKQNGTKERDMLYEIVLMCPFCEAEKRLGTVQAESAYEAKQKAESLWPDARYEEMIARSASTFASVEDAVTSTTD